LHITLTQLCFLDEALGGLGNAKCSLLMLGFLPYVLLAKGIGVDSFLSKAFFSISLKLT
jgi:hypothetical protein